MHAGAVEWEVVIFFEFVHEVVCVEDGVFGDANEALAAEQAAEGTLAGQTGEEESSPELDSSLPYARNAAASSFAFFGTSNRSASS